MNKISKRNKMLVTLLMATLLTIVLFVPAGVSTCNCNRPEQPINSSETYSEVRSFDQLCGLIVPDYWWV